MGGRGLHSPLGRLRESGLVLPTVLLLLGGISYGSLFTANKIAIDAGFPFIAYAFWQALFASAALLILSAVFSRPPSLRPENLRVFALVAVFGFLGPLLVVTFVADTLPPAVLTLCAALIPAATYVLTLALRFDRFRWFSVAGVLLGLGGILLIVVPTGSLPGADAWVWVLFSLLMPLSAAVNNVAGARFSPPAVSALALAGGMMMVAALLLLLVMLADGDLFLPTDAEASGLWGLLWASAGQAITYACFFEIVRRAGALFFAQLNYVVVAAGIFWASIFFGTALSHWVWAAVAVLVASLVLINAGTARGLRERTAGYEAKRAG